MSEASEIDDAGPVAASWFDDEVIVSDTDREELVAVGYPMAFNEPFGRAWRASAPRWTAVIAQVFRDAAPVEYEYSTPRTTSITANALRRSALCVALRHPEARRTLMVLLALEAQAGEHSIGRAARSLEIVKQWLNENPI